MEILFSAILRFRNVHEQMIQEKIAYLVTKIAPQGDPKSHMLFCTSLSIIQFHQDMCCKKLMKDFKTDLVNFSIITFNELPFVTVSTFLPAFRISSKMT